MGFEVAYDPGINLELVKAVQKHPVIFNVRKYPPVEYRGLLDVAWTKVAAEMGENESYCKGRWTNIRGCFKRYLKNRAQSSTTKIYYLAPYLKFLLPYMKVPDGFSIENEEVELGQFHIDSNVSTDGDMDVSNEIEVKLVDSDGDEESFFIPRTSNQSDEVDSTDVETNADWQFLSSLLPDVKKMDDRQKSKFRNALLTAVDTILYGEGF